MKKWNWTYTFIYVVLLNKKKKKKEEQTNECLYVCTHLFIIWINPSRYHMNLFCRNFAIFKNKLLAGWLGWLDVVRDEFESDCWRWLLLCLWKTNTKKKKKKKKLSKMLKNAIADVSCSTAFDLAMLRCVSAYVFVCMRVYFFFSFCCCCSL